MEIVPNRFEGAGRIEVLTAAEGLREAAVNDRVLKGIRRPCRSKAGALPASEGKLKGMPAIVSDERRVRKKR